MIISLKKKKKKEALCAVLLTTQRKQMALFGCILMVARVDITFKTTRPKSAAL